MKQLMVFGIIFFSFMACKPASKADVDFDGETDVYVKGNKAKDANGTDNILIIDGLVVNAVSNDQWKPVDGNLSIVKEPTFKMKYNPTRKSWDKILLN